MVDTEHLDRVERFTQWLEERRKQAGFTQKELAELCGISHSYYSKVVHIGHLRRTYGDGSREVTAPKSLKTFEGALNALEDRLGSGCRDEGMEFWSSLDPSEETSMNKAIPTVNGNDKAAILSDVLEALPALEAATLKVLLDVIRQLK